MNNYFSFISNNPDIMSSRTDRRKFIHMGSAILLFGLSGCSGGGGDAGDATVGDTPSPAVADMETPTPEPTTQGTTEDSESVYLVNFRGQINAELEIEIRTLDESGTDVLIEYESNYETGTENWGYEVGFIGGLFASLVDDGWDVGRLAGTVTGTQGKTFVWHVMREWAIDFINEEISNEEFAEQIFQTMKEE